MSTLENKIAVITGGNSGIGLATARLFKKEGAKVIITARNEQRLAESKAELGNEFDILQVDVAKVDQLEHFFNQVGEKFGKIDVLFLNAGIAGFIPLELLDEAAFDRMNNINVKGVIFGVQKALPHFAETASVILNTSVVNQRGMATASVYAAGKAAVRSLARTLSGELIGRGIRVNAVSPGPIETPIFGKMGMPEEVLNEMASGLVSTVPMGRFGKAEEVAQAALFFASPASSFVTGTELEVDGGMVNV